MEAYELAVDLLLKDGEPCWNTSGNLWLDKNRVPHLTAKVSIGTERCEEIREAEFTYTSQGWVRS